MRDPCPRCGAHRPPVGACPDCGYEAPHPGVLGAYKRAAGLLVDRPALLLPYLVPTAILAGVQTLLVASGVPQAGGTTLAESGAVLAGLFVTVAWYLAVVGGLAPAAARSAPIGLPGGPVVRGALVGAGIVTAPWIALVGVQQFAPSGGLAAVALLASLVLLVGAVGAAGRAVGLPVEAGLHGRDGRQLVRQGNRRARENGGLGLVFLGLVLSGLLPLVPGVVLGLGLADPNRWLLGAAGAGVLWLVGAWVGTAIGVGLAGRTEGPEATFACPACGEQATVEDGRARCECGLEGPYYEAPTRPGAG